MPAIGRRKSKYQSPGAFAPAPGGGSVTWTKTASPAGDNSGTSSVNFATVALGSATASDLVIVFVNTTNVVATSVTVAGVSATKVVEESSAISGLQIWKAAGTGSATGTINVAAGGNFGEVTILVGKLSGQNSTETGTNTAVTSGADPISTTITVPSNGVGLAAVVLSSGASGSWANATSDYSVTTPGGARFTLANTTTSGSQSPSYGTLGGASAHMVLAAWGP